MERYVPKTTEWDPRSEASKFKYDPEWNAMTALSPVKVSPLGSSVSCAKKNPKCGQKVAKNGFKTRNARTPFLVAKPL